jgi:hypothetical protein
MWLRIAHLKTHLAYLMNPALGMNPLIAPTFIPAILNHIKEHIALWYATSVFDLGSEATGTDIGDMLKEIKDTEAKQAFDAMLAEASQTVAAEAANVFASLPPVIQQAQQLMQQFAPQPPMDPNVQLAQQQMQMQTQRDQQRAAIDAQKLQLTAQDAQQKAQLDAAKLQLDAQQMQQRMAADQQRQEGETQRKMAELQVRQAMNTQDNLTAMELAQLEVETGERIAVSTGTGINPQP